jgi:hypothetical protein
MQISFETGEVDLLRRLLLKALREMREEVYKTENSAWRQSLKDDEVMLKGILARLGEPIADGVVDERVA